MKKNGDLAAMYETIPAVSGLNRVEGFDPFSLLGRTVSPVTGEEGLQLGLAYKKLWFRLAYPKGRLQMNRVSLTEQTAVFEAQVYLDCGDANPVSSFVSGCARDDVPGGRYIQAAQYEAMDVALTDAGFGLQFADVCAGDSMAGDGEKPVHSGNSDAVKGEGTARSAGTAGAAVPGGNIDPARTVVRQFPGVTAGNALKTAPGAQPAGFRQPIQPAGPQGQGGQPARNGQTVPATVTQGQKAPMMGARRPVPAAMPQGQGTQPTGARQPVPPTMPQGQTVLGAQMPGTGQHAQDTALKGQGMHPRESGTLAQPAATKPAMASIPGGKAVPGDRHTGETAIGSAASGIQPVAQKPTMAAQGKANPPMGATATGDVLPVPGQQPPRNAKTVPPTQAQAQTAQQTAATGLVQPLNAAGSRAASGKAGPKTLQPAAAQNQGIEAAGASGTIQAHASQAENVQPARNAGKTQPEIAQSLPPKQPAAAQPAQPAVPQELPDQLPVSPASPGSRSAVRAASAERGETARPATDMAAGSMDSLPVPPVEKSGQTPVQAPPATADTLPVPAGNPEKRKPQSSVQEAIALLRGQVPPAGTPESTAGADDGSTMEGMTENAAPSPAETIGSNQPGNGEAAQGGPAPRYTPDMPVEEIVGLMTLEEAGKVVVDTGVSRGQTVAEVAERRPPSLRYYRYGGYKGDNNILRAAAQIMLDSIEGKKAS